ncbi:MAG: DUF3488 domain-containing protein [Candidatus Koribacter versatilis]|uniref:DUF3488 domain-containing protein n=1 Tax=Candidatus Korobacter versatilis TaxID=658062 RepID=A0A932A738_9BACT|nr:DUF3488 domain-containing protein [Candidatus Koribacter versatilis]
MSTAAIPRDTRSAVERYFEIWLFLLVLTGFATLAATGKLDLPALLFVSAALVFRGYLLAKRETLMLSEQWTTYLTLAYVLFYLADFLFISRTFVGASVHLVLFSMVVKIFSVQRDRDLLYLAVLSFLEVLAAAVLTVDSVFLGAFAIFLLVAVATFMALEMRRTARRTPMAAREHAHARHFGRALALTAALLMCAILLAGTVIFFVLPRISANYLAAFAPRSVLATGFTDEVNLGQIGEIQQSSEVVMHVRVEGDSTGKNPDLHWRAIALANFDGRKWTNPAEQLRLLRARDGNFVLKEIVTAATPLPKNWQAINYRVMLEPGDSHLYFLAGQALGIFGNYRVIGYDRGFAFYNLDREHTIGTYQAVANVSVPTAVEPGGAIPPEVALYYLQLPAVDPRVRDLAANISASASSDFQRAKLLEEYLRAKFGYTLELPSTVPADPIANFLFARKQGHCEYFASSMALMLRTQGIPSRVVNGFRGGEFNTVTGNYIIRARDAHSWVEAYFPGAGWVPFDPTPSSPQPSAVGFGRIYYYLDAAREFWREWVINYDFSHQNAVSNSAVVRGRRFFERSRMTLQRYYAQMLQRARHLQDRAAETPQSWGTTGAFVVLGLVLLLNVRRIVRALRSLRLARTPGRAPQQAASIWYERMTRSVARRGYEKTPSQTPFEFVFTIDDPYLRARVEAFTRAYESARFADSPADAERLPHLFDDIQTSAR